jgi:surfactin synthase thioesterase subunit
MTEANPMTDRSVIARIDDPTGTRLMIIEDHELLAQSLAFALRADGFDHRVGHFGARSMTS